MHLSSCASCRQLRRRYRRRHSTTSMRQVAVEFKAPSLPSNAPSHRRRRCCCRVTKHELMSVALSPPTNADANAKGATTMTIVTCRSTIVACCSRDRDGPEDDTLYELVAPFKMPSILVETADSKSDDNDDDQNTTTTLTTTATTRTAVMPQAKSSSSASRHRLRSTVVRSSCNRQNV